MSNICSSPRHSRGITDFIYGQNNEQLKLYGCSDEEKCLTLQLKPKAMDQNEALLAKVKTLIGNIADKFLMETHGSTVSLAADEQNLIETSSVPILKIISLETALKGHNVSMSVEEYGELVTFDFLISYMDHILDDVYQALSALEYSQIDGEPIRNFKEEVKYVKSYLSEQRHGAFEHMNTVLAIKQRLIQVELMVKSAFAEYRTQPQ